MAGIELSDEALLLLLDSGALLMFEDHRDEFIEMLFQKNPATVLAIYEAAKEVIAEAFEKQPEIFEEIRLFAEKTDQLMFGQIRMLMACYLRDEAMKQVKVG